jgi:ligand-binding sensor domain-containing protein/serine phosphatase RsbU (regulator of sigma subunit)
MGFNFINLKLKAMFNFKLTLLFCFFSFNVSAQVFNFINYSQDDGLQQLYIYSICQDKFGNMYFGTEEGLVKYNSKQFITYSIKDGLAENFIASSYVSNDNTVWCGHYQEGVSYLKNGKIYHLNKANFENTSVTAFAEDNFNNIYIATSSKGVYKYNTTAKKISLAIDAQSRISKIIINKQTNKLLLLQKYGIQIYDVNKNNKPLLKKEEVFDFELSDITQLNASNYFVAARNSTPLLLVVNSSSSSIRKFASTESENYFNEITKTTAIGNVVYAASNKSGLYKIAIKDTSIVKSRLINSTNGLKTNFLATVFRDLENNLWIGTNGFGIDFLRDEKFTYYGESSFGIGNNNIHSMVFDGINTLWAGNSNGLMEFNIEKNNLIKSYNSKNGFVDDEVSTLFIDNRKTIWIGTTDHGLFRKLESSSTIESINKRYNLNINNITCITQSINDNIYIGTKEGLIIFDEKTNKFKNITTNEGLANNVISDILVDKTGKIWFACYGSPPFSFQNNSYTVYKDIKKLQNFKLSAIAEDLNGNIWFATEGEGLFKFDGESFENYVLKDGLLSNYCYSIFVDDENSVWTTHKNGISVKRNNVKSFLPITQKEGFVSPQNNKNCIAKYKNNSILFGTQNGIIKFNSNEIKTNFVPPKVIIERIYVNNKLLDFLNPIYPYSYYKLKFEFISPYYTAPQKLSYRYLLKGLDTAYTYIDNSINEVTYNRLSDGEYQFIIEACNENGLWNKTTFSPVIKVEKPIWKLWWFYIIILAVTFYIIKWSYAFKTKKLLDRQIKLQKMVDEKTETIQAKNVELEGQKMYLDKINKNVADSINYAKKIQEAMLSSKSTFANRQDDVFILYKPCHIISGDFYWFSKNKNNNDIVTIAIADCTGHGVPGAMLSMMGSALLSRIVDNNSNVNPSEILALLDNNVRTALKQGEDSNSNDGMDAAVCKIDYQNYTLEFSGANRPLIIIRKGEIIELQASKFAIGSYNYGHAKTFEIHTINIEPNDMIYMFTDGYADQFGGEKNKRFMKKRLLSMLKDIYLLKPEQQCQTVNQTFADWKGINEQIDDVLVIGLKIN